jgi:hypothetical protein
MTTGPLISDRSCRLPRLFMPPSALSCPCRTMSLSATGQPGGGTPPLPLALPPIKRPPGRRETHFSSSSTASTRASADRRSTSVSWSSSPPLLDSVHPENPLELTLLLRFVLQPKTIPPTAALDVVVDLRHLQVSSFLGAPHRQQALANVLGVLVQLRNRATKIIFDMDPSSTISSSIAAAPTASPVRPYFPATSARDRCSSVYLVGRGPYPPRFCSFFATGLPSMASPPCAL